MIIDSDLLKRLEKLSSLKLDDKAREELINDFADILNFVDNLNEIDTKNLDIKIQDYTPLRNDEPIKSNVIDDVLKNAPVASEHFFLVPKIIE